MAKRQSSAPFRTPEELPGVIPVFPLAGAILLPRGTLPLHIFEPRYLTLLDDALAGSRLIGVVQPQPLPGATPEDTPTGQAEHDEQTLAQSAAIRTLEESPQDKSHPLRQIGGVGRITAFSEGDDGHVLITLTGISRFQMIREIENDLPYRTAEVDYKSFRTDFIQGHKEEEVNRDHFLGVLKNYLELNNLTADWDSIHGASTEHLVNTLSMISPYGIEEKQALLEAPDIPARAEILIALAEMELARSGSDNNGSAIQ